MAEDFLKRLGRQLGDDDEIDPAPLGVAVLRRAGTAVRAAADMHRSAVAVQPGHGHGGGGGPAPADGAHPVHVGAWRDFEHQGVLAFLEEWFQLDYAHPRCENDDDAPLHVPMFLHGMSRRRGTPAFNSGPFSPASPPFEVPFGAEGSLTYHCEIHQQMQGKVIVAAGEPAARSSPSTTSTR